MRLATHLSIINISGFTRPRGEELVIYGVECFNLGIFENIS